MKANTPSFLQGGGEMGELIRSTDWSKTPLGFPEKWPTALKIATGIMLKNPFPMYIAWGEEFTQIYNDGYRPILGSTKHPKAIGVSTKESFHEIWDTIGSMFDGVMQGKPVRFSNSMFHLERNGYLEECYFDFAYSPICDENGNIGGVLVTVLETTESVKNLNSLNEAKRQLEIAKIEIEGQRDRLNRFFMEAPAAICVVNGPDLVFELINSGYQDFFPGRDLLGKPLFKAIPEIIGQPIEKIILDVYHNDETFEGKELLVPLARTNNGLIEDRYFNFIYQPRHDVDGKVDGVLVFAFEVTEIVANKLQLKESSERVKGIIEQAPVPMLVTMGEEMIFKEINASMLSLLDKDNSIKGLPLKLALPEIIGQPIYNSLLETYKTGKSFEGIEQKILLKRRGQLLNGYFNIRYHPFYENGKITGVIQSAIDVTEHVTARKKLEEAEDTLKLAISAAQLGTFDMDMEKNSMDWNARCRKLFGISHDDKLSYDYDFALGLHPDDKERVLNVIKKVLIKSESNGDYDVEYRTVGFEDKKVRWVRAMGKAYFDPFDKPIRFIGSVLDITEFKQDELRKNDFIGMVSHELKTPLTSLNGFSQVLQLRSKNHGDEFCTDVLGKMIVQIKKMSTMINGFLNVSRLESGKIHLEKKQFNFIELLTEILEENRLTSLSHELKFQQPNYPIILNADRDKIGSVISNLISNAIKYSPKGKLVVIEAEIEDNELKLYVKDDGMGIAQHDIEKLFDRYYRVETNQMQHISGFGIGLYLSAEIVRRHNGEIWAKSELGTGSTFGFSIPLAV
jgi:two-component system sensor histidine kinase VicK